MSTKREGGGAWDVLGVGGGDGEWGHKGFWGSLYTVA